MQCKRVYTSAWMQVRISADRHLHHLSRTRQEKIVLLFFTMTALLHGGHKHVGILLYEVLYFLDQENCLK